MQTRHHEWLPEDKDGFASCFHSSQLDVSASLNLSQVQQWGHTSLCDNAHNCLS